MRPQDDDFPEVIERTINAALSESIEAGRAIIREIAPKFPPKSKRDLKTPDRCRLYKRDGFRCRYCGGKII